jgi:hypothetical protein
MPHLPPELQKDALAAARDMGDEDLRARALSALTPHLTGNLQSEAVRSWTNVASRLPRDTVLMTLVDLVPVLHRLAGSDAFVRVYNAIRDVCKWWP